MPNLSLRGISKRFGSTLALDGVDFDLVPGEIHALLGENGAGKSTLMNILRGLTQPSAGQIFLDGAQYASAPPRPLRKRALEWSISTFCWFRRSPLPKI